MAKPGRPGARGNKKGPTVGTGGHGRQKLEGKGPTPKATDRSWHVAGKRKAAQERLDAARAKFNKGGADAGAGKPAVRRAPKKDGDAEVVTGRNSVVEALRAKIPASTLYIATRLEMDDREYSFCGPGCMKSFAKAPHQYRAKVDAWVAAQKA